MFVVVAAELSAAQDADHLGEHQFQPSSFNMRYLGRLAGNGMLIRNGDTLANVSYELEGFLGPRGAIMSSGEIIVSPTVLKTIFGTRGVQLHTDDGRLLELRFTEKELRCAGGIAQVEATGNLPATPAEWRARPVLATTLESSEV
jgi:hypothetical protein